MRSPDLYLAEDARNVTVSQETMETLANTAGCAAHEANAALDWKSDAAAKKAVNLMRATVPSNRRAAASAPKARRSRARPRSLGGYASTNNSIRTHTPATTPAKNITPTMDQDGRAGENILRHTG